MTQRLAGDLAETCSAWREQTPTAHSIDQALKPQRTACWRYVRNSNVSLSDWMAICGAPRQDARYAPKALVGCFSKKRARSPIAACCSWTRRRLIRCEGGIRRASRRALARKLSACAVALPSLSSRLWAFKRIEITAAKCFVEKAALARPGRGSWTQTSHGRYPADVSREGPRLPPPAPPHRSSLRPGNRSECRRSSPPLAPRDRGVP